MDKKCKETIVLALSAIAILLIVGFVVTDSRTIAAQERYLDAEELHYDADGPFILIDKETAQAGYYEDNSPVWRIHTDLFESWDPYVYKVYRMDNGLYFIADNCGLPAHRYVLMLTDAELESFKNMPDGAPALVR